jgi:hypothetical protein
MIYKYIGKKLFEKTFDDDTNLKFVIYVEYTSNSMIKAYNFILNNAFLTNEKKTLILGMYTKIKNIYNKLSYLARVYKWKNYKTYDIDTDLYTNPLSNYPDYQKFNLLQNNTIYKFKLADLLNIWNNSLKKSSNLLSTPELPKNPYTNLPIPVHDLINIYIKTTETRFNIPIFIMQLWRCQLNIEKFKFEELASLKEFAIINYVEDSCVDVLYFEINRMLAELKIPLKYKTITIIDSFVNRTMIVSAMKPFVKQYLIASETLNYYKKTLYRKKVIKSLREFYKKNPTFGRRIVVPNRTVATNESELSDTDSVNESMDSTDELSSTDESFLNEEGIF